MLGAAEVWQGDRLTVGNTDLEIGWDGAAVALFPVQDEQGLRLEAVGFTVRTGEATRHFSVMWNSKPGTGSWWPLLGLPERESPP
ncbi:hypothetical protein NHF46_23660 [Arthrobacter alpinus]|nr:hypothetical protein [Arthrobacter alpinus]